MYSQKYLLLCKDEDSKCHFLSHQKRENDSRGLHWTDLLLSLWLFVKCLCWYIHQIFLLTYRYVQMSLIICWVTHQEWGWQETESIFFSFRVLSEIEHLVFFLQGHPLRALNFLRLWYMEARIHVQGGLRWQMFLHLPISTLSYL